jgi:opacity protein-like surface antigen
MRRLLLTGEVKNLVKTLLHPGLLVMKTNLFALGLMGAGALLPVCGHAQGRSFITADAGPYTKFEIGPTFQTDGTLTKFTGIPGGSAINYDVGFNFDVAVGYAFNKYFSVEGEFGWNGNQISSVQGVSQQSTDLYNVPFVANVVLQYPIARTRVVPYLGGGVGGSVSVFDTDAFSNGAVTLVGSTSDFVLAYQAFAGVRIEINETMFAGVGYKYFATGDSTFSYESVFGGPDVDIGVSGGGTHMVLFSFNWKF